MNKVILICLFLNAISSNAMASSFKFNNKNLHALTALLCSETSPKLSKDIVLISKILIDRNDYGSQKDQTRIDISGFCNIKINLKSKEQIDLGEEISISMDRRDLKNISATIGMNQLSFFFKSSQLTHISIQSIMSNQKKSLSFKNSNWAQSDSIYNIAKTDKVHLSPVRSISAVESNLSFAISKDNHFYNIWSYEAFGCSSLTSTSQQQCEKYLSLTK